MRGFTRDDNGIIHVTYSASILYVTKIKIDSRNFILLIKEIIYISDKSILMKK